MPSACQLAEGDASAPRGRDGLFVPASRQLGAKPPPAGLIMKNRYVVVTRALLFGAVADVFSGGVRTLLGASRTGGPRDGAAIATRRLLASIHDVGPRFEREVDMLAERFVRHIGSPRFAMLVVPDHWGAAPLSAARAFQAKLRGWSDAGIEMFVHGWTHRDDGTHRGAAGLKARHMTAGEGEFLGLGQAEALRRMVAGRQLIEDVTGRATAGFVAPAWLYGEGARAALGEAGFAIAEDHWRVWRPGDGAILARGPVVTWASRSAARIRSSLGFAAVARTALRPLGTLRVAVHPGDTGVPRLLASIDATLAAACRQRTPARYGDLRPAGAAS